MTFPLVEKATSRQWSALLVQRRHDVSKFRFDGLAPDSIVRIFLTLPVHDGGMPAKHRVVGKAGAHERPQP